MLPAPLPCPHHCCLVIDLFIFVLTVVIAVVTVFFGSRIFAACVCIDAIGHPIEIFEIFVTHRVPSLDRLMGACSETEHMLIDSCRGNQCKLHFIQFGQARRSFPIASPLQIACVGNFAKLAFIAFTALEHSQQQPRASFCATLVA
jgi:hypothetical protein